MDITDRVIIDDDGDVWTVNLSTEDPVSPSSNSSPPSECSNDENTFLTKNDSNIFPITTNIKTEPDDTAIVTCTGSTSNDDPVASPYHSSTPPACSDENISLPNNESNIQIIPNNESNIKIIQNNELNIQIIIKTEPTDGSHANSSSVASHNNSTDKPILLSHGVPVRRRRKDCHSQIRADPQCSDGLRNILALRCQRNVEVQPSLPATKYNLATSSNPRLISFDSIVRNRLLSSPTSYSNSCPVPKSSLSLTRSQESNNRNVKGMDSIPLSHVRTTCTLTTSTFANTSSVPSQITTTTVSRSVLNENSSNMEIKAEPVDRSLSGYPCALPGTAQNMHQSQVTTEEVEVKAVQEVRGTGQTVVVGSQNLPLMTPSEVGHMQYPQPNRCDPQDSDNWLQDFDVLSYEPFTNYPVKIFLPSNKIRCLECGTFLKKHKRCMQCSMCSFSTVCDASLSTHYKKKHHVVLNDLKAKELCFDENWKPQKKYKCLKCGLALENSPLNIKKHMNFHGRSGFVCFFCMRACYSCSDFIKHLKKCGYSKEMYPCTSTDNPGVSLFLSTRNTLEVFCNTFKFFIEKGRIPAKQHCCILRRTHKHLQGLHWHYIQRAVYTLIAKRSISTAKKQKQVNDVSIYQKAKPQRRYETAYVQNGGEAFPTTATITRSVPTLLATLAAPFFNDVTPITGTTGFNNGTTPAVPFFHNKTTLTFGANSGTLMNNSSINTTHITNHGTTLTTVVNRTTSMTIANHSTTLTTVANSGITLTTVANSGTTLTTVVNRTTSMTIANSGEALTTVANSGTTPMTIANSGEALTTVVNSGTTHSIVANMGLKFLKGVENTATTFTTGVVNSKTMHTTPITNSKETLITLSKGTAIKSVAKGITTLTYKKPDADSRTIPTTVTRSGTTLTKSLPVPVANSGTILATPFHTSGSTMANPFVNSGTIPLLQNSFVNSGTIPLLTNSYTNRGTIPVAPVANVGTLSATPFANIGTLSATPIANIGTIPATPVANIGTLSATPIANIGTIPATPVANIGTLSATPIANIGTIPATPFANIGTLSATPFANVGTLSATSIANIGTIPATPVANIGTIPGAPIANTGTVPATPVASGTTSSLSSRIVPVLTLVNGKFQITLKLRDTVSQEFPTGVPNIQMEGSRTTDGYNAKTSQTASATQAISGTHNIKIEPSTLGGCGAAISRAASAMQAISGTHNIRVEPSTLGGCSAPTILTSATVQPTIGGCSAPTILTSATVQPTCITGTSIPNIKTEPPNAEDGYGGPTIQTASTMKCVSGVEVTSSISAPTIPTSATLPTTRTSVMSNIKIEDISTIHEYTSTIQTPSTTQAISAVPNIKMEPVNSLDGYGAPTMPTTHGMEYRSTIDRYSASTTQTASTAQAISGMPNIKMEVSNTVDGYVFRANPTASLSTTATIPTASLSTTATIPTTSLSTIATMLTTSGMEESSAISGYSATAIPTAAATVSRSWSICNKKGSSKTVHCTAPTIQTMGSTMQAISGLSNPNEESSTAEDCIDSSIQTSSDPCIEQSTFSSVTESDLHVPVIVASPNRNKTKSSSTSMSKSFTNSTSTVARTNKRIKKSDLTCTVANTSRNKTQSDSISMNRSSAKSDVSCSVAPTRKSLTKNLDSTATVACSNKTMTKSDLTSNVANTSGNKTISDSTSADRCLTKSDLTNTVTMADLVSIVISKSFTKLDSTSTVASTNKTVTKSNITCTVGNTSRDLTNLDSIATVASTNKILTMTDLAGNVANTSRNLTNLDSTTTVASTNRSKTKSDLTCTVANTSRNKTQSDSISMNRSSAKSDVSCSVAPTSRSLTNLDSTTTVASTNKTVTMTDLAGNVANTSRSLTNLDSTTTVGNTNKTVTMTDLACTVAITTRSLVNLDLSSLASTNTTKTKSNITFTVGSISRDLTKLDSTTTVASTGRMLPQEEKENPKTEGQGRAFTICSSGNEKTVNQQSLISSSSYFTRSCSTIARTNRSMLPNRGKKTRTESQTNAPRFMLVPILPVQPAIFYNDAVMKSICTDSKTHQLMAESGYSCTVVGRNKNLTKSDFICIITNSKRKMKVSALTRTFQNLMENLSIKFSNSDDNQRGSSIVCNNVQSEVNVDDSSSTPHGQDKQLTTSTTNLSNENDLDKNGEKIDKRSSSHSQSSNNENEQSISKIGQSNTGVEDSVHVTEQSSDGVKQSVNETGESSHGVEQSVSETGQASDGVEQSNNETGQLNHVVEQSVSEAGQSNHGVEQFVSETEKSNLGVEHSNNETGQLNHGGEQSVSEAGQSNHGVEQSGNECQKIQSHPETEPDCSRASMMEKISDTVQIVAESGLNNLGTENPTKKSSTSKAPWSKDNDELDVGEVILYVEDNSDKLPQLFASWFNVDMTVLDQSNEGHILTAGLLHEGSIPVRQSNKVIMNMNKSTVSDVVNNQSDESITSDNQWEVVGTTDDLVFKFYEDTVCVLYKTVDMIKPSNKNFTKNMKLMNSQSEVIESVGLELLVKAIYSAKEHAGKQLGDALENTTVLVVSKEFVKQSSHLDQEEFYYMMSALNHPHVTKEVMKGLSKRAKDGKFAIEEETRFCVGCGSVFDTKLDYLSHLKANASHYEGKNICIHCGVCFGTGTELSIHIKFTHMKNWIEQARHQYQGKLIRTYQRARYCHLGNRYQI